MALAETKRTIWMAAAAVVLLLVGLAITAPARAYATDGVIDNTAGTGFELAPVVDGVEFVDNEAAEDGAGDENAGEPSSDSVEEGSTAPVGDEGLKSDSAARIENEDQEGGFSTVEIKDAFSAGAGLGDSNEFLSEPPDDKVDSQTPMLQTAALLPQAEPCIVSQADPDIVAALTELTYKPTARIATGSGFEYVGVQRLEGLDYLLLPSYANLSALNIGWTEEAASLGMLVYAAAKAGGTYSNDVFDATECTVDAQGARLVYVRATAKGTVHLLRVLKSSGVRTLYLKSDDPIAEGREFVEASPDHSAKATGSMTLVSATGGVVVQDAELTQIKGRGNSTWGADKKPYQIKLADKASLLDGVSANKSKTWVLLANAYDDSQLRNYVALKTALSAGLSATTDCEFVDLYYDGDYRGLYLLCEKVQVGAGRVEITEIDDSALEDLPTVMGVNSYNYAFRYVNAGNAGAGLNVTGGFLIELDNATYASERCYFNTSIGYFVLKSPENGTYDQVKYISEYVQAAINAASVAEGNAAKYFDLASLARYFLVNELAKNSDYMRYSSTFFYKDAGSDVLHAGPVWDFDLAFGVHEYEGFAEYVDAAGVTDPNATFYVRNKQFVNAVKQVLSGGFLSKAKTWTGSGSGSLRGIASAMSSALKLDELKWGYYDPDNVVVVKFDTYAESVDYLRDWLGRRINWMDSDLIANLEVLSAQPSYSPGSSASVTRISGQVALDTMSSIVNAGEFDSGKFVILVTSDGYWDALTAAGIAGLVNAPIIMTPTKQLAEQARAQLAKLRPKTIIVCGGTAAITNAVASAASQAAGNARIERCQGATAIETAISIYERAHDLTGKQWATTAFICTNDGYWDALSAAPISYAMHMPIFLTNGASLITNETVAALKRGGIHAVYIVGGIKAISLDVEKALEDASIAISGRLAGETAIETSEQVAEYGINRGMSANLMGVATTNGYWDALAGSAFCGKKHSVLVLVNAPECHSITSFMFLNNARVRQAYVFGGPAAVAQATLEAVRRKLSGLI